MPKKTTASNPAPAAPEPTHLLVTVSPRGVARIKSGHPWVYRSDVYRSDVHKSDLASAGNIPPGALVQVADPRGKILGAALYSSSSQIAIRMLTRSTAANPQAAIPDLPALVADRIRAAIAYRNQFISGTNAYRVVFSEADFLPGLIIDRYNDVLSVQILTQAMDAEVVRGAIIATLVEELHPSGIVERVDPRIRELEQLPPRASALLWGKKSSTIITMNSETRGLGESGEPSAESPSQTSVPQVRARGRGPQSARFWQAGGTGRANQGDHADRAIHDPATPSGLRFHFDALAGQKTGAFLDQRENYAGAGRYARGHALDVFCYQGGFALHLASHCESVTGVDSSRPALEMAEKNAALNAQLLEGSALKTKEIEWIEANAFDLLRDYAAARQADQKKAASRDAASMTGAPMYDIVVLDPPAFAKTKRDLPKALSGYKELNLRALKILRPGGILVTCSCSFHVSAADFLEVVASAAQDAHRSVRILESRTQAQDHPILLNAPETGYLKCLILHVSN